MIPIDTCAKAAQQQDKRITFVRQVTTKDGEYKEIAMRQADAEFAVTMREKQRICSLRKERHKLSEFRMTYDVALI